MITFTAVAAVRSPAHADAPAASEIAATFCGAVVQRAGEAREPDACWRGIVEHRADNPHDAGARRPASLSFLADVAPLPAPLLSAAGAASAPFDPRLAAALAELATAPVQCFTWNDWPGVTELIDAR